MSWFNNFNSQPKATFSKETAGENQVLLRANFKKILANYDDAALNPLKYANDVQRIYLVQVNPAATMRATKFTYKAFRERWTGRLIMLAPFGVVALISAYYILPGFSIINDLKKLKKFATEYNSEAE